MRIETHILDIRIVTKNGAGGQPREKQGGQSLFVESLKVDGDLRLSVLRKILASARPDPIKVQTFFQMLIDEF